MHDTTFGDTMLHGRWEGGGLDTLDNLRTDPHHTCHTIAAVQEFVVEQGDIICWPLNILGAGVRGHTIESRTQRRSKMDSCFSTSLRVVKWRGTMLGGVPPAPPPPPRVPPPCPPRVRCTAKMMIFALTTTHREEPQEMVY